jgi:hypothetical protein
MRFRRARAMPRKTPRTREQVKVQTMRTQFEISQMLIEASARPLARPLSWKQIQARFPHLSRSTIHWYLDRIHKDADSLVFV